MFQKLRKNKKGFTLIEVIVVIVILAVLMAIAVPSVLKYINEADHAKYMAQARGQMISIQSELTKDYTLMADKSTYQAKIDEVVEGVPEIDISQCKVYSQAPTLNDEKDGWNDDGVELATGESPERITSYEIAFKDGTKALVNANQNVIIDFQ